MSQINPMSFLNLANLGMNINDMQQGNAQREFANKIAQARLQLDQDQNSRAQDEWGLQRQIVQDQINNLPQRHTVESANLISDLVNQGSSPDDALAIAGKATPMYVLQDPTAQMPTQDKALYGMGQNIRNAFLKKQAMQDQEMQNKQGWQDLQKDQLGLEREKFQYAKDNPKTTRSGDPNATIFKILSLNPLNMGLDENSKNQLNAVQMKLLQGLLNQNGSGQEQIPVQSTPAPTTQPSESVDTNPSARFSAAWQAIQKLLGADSENLQNIPSLVGVAPSNNYASMFQY